MSTMMSVVTATLLAGGGVTGLVGQRIYNTAAPQNAGYPNIILYRIREDEEELLQGASQWFDGRFSVECRSLNAPDGADLAGEAVIDWLRDKLNYAVAGGIAEYRREGTDVTQGSENSQNGQPFVCTRTIDFYIRWRRSA